MVLQKTAYVLRQGFRSVDYVCRIGRSEFAVIMTRADSTMEQLVLDKVSAVNRVLTKPDDGLPAVSLSAGIAFGDRCDPHDDLFENADAALLRLRESGSSGCEVY
jgi:diguanylate cyclase (GGDEF)-like protein